MPWPSFCFRLGPLCYYRFGYSFEWEGTGTFVFGFVCLAAASVIAAMTVSPVLRWGPPGGAPTPTVGGFSR